jgi:hypothetical protein
MRGANLSGVHISTTKKKGVSEICLAAQASVKNVYEVLNMGRQLKCSLGFDVGYD